MKFKVILILLTCLLGTTLAHPYPDNEEEASNTSAAKDYSSEGTNDNEEIQAPALLQQQVEVMERKFLQDLELEMETETEVSVKTVRNISDNQLTQNYNSMEQEGHTPQSAEDYVNDSKMEDEETETERAEEEQELQLKRARMGRLLPSTTTTSSTPTNIPNYIRQANTSEDPNLSQEHLNLSLSDYTDDDSDTGALNTRRQQSTVRPAANSNENEDIVPLAMRYYDDDEEVSVEAARVSPHDDDEYQQGGDNNKLNNEPVPMPQQQWLSPPQSRQASPPSYEPQQNSSEEYYDEESLSREEESSTASIATTTAAAIAAATAPATTSSSSTDHNLVVFAGFPLSNNQPTTTAPVPAARSSNISPPTIGQPPLAQPSSYNGNNNAAASPQFDPTLGPTTPPYPIVAAAAAAAAAAPATGDKKGKQIPIVATTTNKSTSSPSSAAGTTSKSISSSSNAADNNISIGSGNGSSRRHLLPHEQLRNYIEDAYIRMPLAVIVDPSAESLEKTKALWNEALRANLNIKIILVTLNESDIPAAFNFNNTRQFLTGLNSIKEHEGGDAFRGISHAAELVPYDSAVFISTATLANHTDQVHDAAITLLKKRIRLYLIWFGERALSENETQDTVGGILGEVAIRSGGEVLHLVGTENSMEFEGSTHTIVADALRGSQELDVPVDTTLSSLHVKIDKLMRRAVLETPNGG